MTKFDIDKTLETFATVNAFLMQATEEQCEQLLTAEISRDGQRRYSVANRIYGRFNELRVKRERNQILKGLTS